MNIIKVIFLTLLVTACASNFGEKTKKSTKQTTNSSKNLVIKTIVFSQPDAIRTAIKNECVLPEKLASFIKKYLNDQYTVVENSVNSDVLEVQITQVHGLGGSVWSGPKWVQVKGELKRGGKVIADFKAKRITGGGAFGYMKGTCSILGRCIHTLGKDIATWLKSPTKKALLGNL
ncbi:MAG: hypothetical protein KAG26_00195 [Methylococcales bacterium]|nr:hypothetical protein [Methylococcales bacterium]